MDRTAWSDKFRLGIEAIDQQHRQLFELIAKLNRLLDAQAGTGEIQLVLGQFVRWAEIHFASEETLLAVAGYPGMAEHAAEHRAFVATLDKNIKLVGSRPIAVTETKIASLLSAWLQQHILENDRSYVSHVLASIRSPAGLPPGADGAQEGQP